MESQPIVCPGCQAKLKVGRVIRPRITCPRCGQEFDCPPPPAAEDLDPFAADADKAEATRRPTPKPEQSPEPIDEFETALKPKAKPKPRDPDEIDFGDERFDLPEEAEANDHLPPAPPLRRPVSAATFRKAVEESPRRNRRRKKRFAPSIDALWLYLAGAVLLAIVGFVGWMTTRPGAIFGRSLRPDEIAGTYVSEENPKLILTFLADGTWEMYDGRQWIPNWIPGLVYSIEGRKIICDVPEEQKVEPKQPVFVDRPFALRHRSGAERFIAEFSGLIFKDGAIISPTKGRFKRQPDPNAADPAAAAPAAAK